MAISPIVQQYQQQQQSIVQQSSTPEQLSFNKEFGDAAYELLSAKYPRLLPYVVTFKILDSGTEDNENNSVAVGTFVINRDKDIEYIPVVLHDGSITSCEMLYNKRKDTFAPLIAKEVKAIVDDNRTTNPSLVKSPSIESTDQLYKNMFRPPMSSHPIMAGDHDIISALPDSAKQTLYNYFIAHPETLAKVASFYPVEVMAAKLAPGKQEKVAAEKEIETFKYLDKVIKLDDLTKEAAELLTEDLKQQILDKGYAVSAEIKDPAGVIPYNNIESSIEKVFNVQEFSDRLPIYGSGNLLQFDGHKFVKVPCISIGGTCFTSKGASYCTNGYQPNAQRPGNPIVIADFKEGITEEALTNSGMFSKVSGSSFNKGSNYIVYPAKNGSFKCSYMYLSNVTTRNVAGVIFVGGPDSEVCFTPELKVGCIKGATEIYPMDSYMPTKPLATSETYIKSIQQLISIVKSMNTPLQIAVDGPDINLIDRALDKTAQFKSEVDLVTYLVTQYNFDKTAADLLLEHKKVILIKTAFDGTQGTKEEALRGTWNNMPQLRPSQMQRGPSMRPSQMQAQAKQAQGQEQEQGSQLMDESMIEDMAEFGDSDMLDTGMIASLAHSDDIKSLLIDSNGSFKDTVSEVGKSLLLLSVKKTDVEEQYGREDYSNVMHKLRNVFTTLGHLVFDLDEYTNNRSYKADEI